MYINDELCKMADYTMKIERMQEQTNVLMHIHENHHSARGLLQKVHLLVITEYLICQFTVKHFFFWTKVGWWFDSVKWLSPKKRHLVNFGGKHKELLSLYSTKQRENHLSDEVYDEKPNEYITNNKTTIRK